MKIILLAFFYRNWIIPGVLPRKQGSWGQHVAHLGPVGPRWAPCWPHEPCYQCWSIPWPLMPQLLMSPGHQQLCYWQGFQLSLPYMCWVIIEKNHIFFMFPKINPAPEEVRKKKSLSSCIFQSSSMLCSIFEGGIYWVWRPSSPIIMLTGPAVPYLWG